MFLENRHGRGILQTRTRCVARKRSPTRPGGAPSAAVQTAGAHPTARQGQYNSLFFSSLQHVSETMHSIVLNLELK